MHKTTDVREEETWEVDIKTGSDYHQKLFTVEATTKFQAYEYASGKLQRDGNNYEISEDDLVSIGIFPNYE